MRAIHPLTLLSLCPGIALAQGVGGYGYAPPGYSDDTLAPTVTATITATEVSRVTFWTGCPCAPTVSSFSGVPISSVSHGPWLNATSAPGGRCSDSPGLPSTALNEGNPNSTFVTPTSQLAAPTWTTNSSSVLPGWNHTTAVSLTFTGTVGTTEAVDLVGTSSVHWPNSTWTTAWESTSVLSLTVTSSIIATLNGSMASQWQTGPTAPGPIGTGFSGNASTGGPTSHEPSLTYQTTATDTETSPSAIANGATNSAPIPPSAWPLPTSWSISTASAIATPFPGNTSTPSNHTSARKSASGSEDVTTSTSNPVLTTDASTPVSTLAALSSTPLLTNTTTSPPTSIPTSTSTTPSSSSPTPGDDDYEYGSYSYAFTSEPPSSNPTPTLTSSSNTATSSVDPVVFTNNDSTDSHTNTHTNTRTTTSTGSRVVVTTVLGSGHGFPTTFLTRSREVVAVEAEAAADEEYEYGDGGY